MLLLYCRNYWLPLYSLYTVEGNLKNINNLLLLSQVGRGETFMAGDYFLENLTPGGKDFTGGEDLLLHR